MKKCLFIINPSSGTKVIHKRLDSIIGKLVLDQVVNKVDVFYTKKKDDAYKRCLKIKDGQYDFVVSVGGDGTVNEIIHGFVENKLETPLAILPGGTVNDFATHLDLPSSTNEFIKMIKSFKTKQVDVGKVNDEYFANVLAGGMFSDISFHVSKPDKEKFGPLAYYAAGITELPTQLATQLDIDITIDNVKHEHTASLFMITNTSQVGGLKNVTPYADVTDGMLDVLIINKSNVLEMLQIMVEYQNGNYSHPHLNYYQGKDIHIECKQDIIYDIDGEEASGFPVDVKVIPQAIHVLVKED